MFASRQKYEDESDVVMHILVKLLMNSLYGEQICKDFEEKFACKSECWMMIENDEKVKDYCNIGYGNNIVKPVVDARLEDEVIKLNTLPLHLGAFLLSNSKILTNNFIHAIGGFCTIDVYHTDTDSLYVANKQWDKLDKAGLVEKICYREKKDYEEGVKLYGLSVAPKKNFC